MKTNEAPKSPIEIANAGFKTVMTATTDDSELSDILSTACYINTSNNGIIIGIPIKTSGNAANDYSYTLTMPLVNTDGAAINTNFISIMGYDGAAYTVDLLRVANVIFNGTAAGGSGTYKVFKMFFTQVNASLSDFIVTKTMLDSTTYNLSPSQIIKVNGANLEILFALSNSLANNDLKVRYYTLKLSIILFTKFFRYWSHWIIHSFWCKLVQWS